MSGGTEADALKQHGTELKTSSKARKRIILRAAECGGKVAISALQGAALRSELRLSLHT